MIYNNTELNKIIDDFLEKTKISATLFGIKAAKQPNLVFLIRKGRSCNEKTQNKILKFMNNYEVAE